MDRIGSILGYYLEAAKLQLSLMEDGYRIELPSEDEHLVPNTREGLMVRISELEAAINRHEARNAKGS